MPTAGAAVLGVDRVRADLALRLLKVTTSAG
jgi:hypothetical protein